MAPETRSDMNDACGAISRSRRRLIAGAVLMAAGAVGAEMGTADARKRKKKKPATQTVTRTYRNDGQIVVPAVANTVGAANPFPSSITVTDLSGATLRSVTVTLKGVSHGNGNEIAVMVAKDTVNAILMGRAGGIEDIVDATITFDDNAESALPESAAVVSGRFQPTNYYPSSVLPNLFKAPAPLASGNSLLSAFRGADPIGSWRLYVTDPVIGGADGAVTGGWELTITADMPKKRKKKKKR